MTIGNAGDFERHHISASSKVAGWEATLKNAKAKGHILTIKLDVLCMELAKHGLTISDLPDDDPRLVEIRGGHPERMDSIKVTKQEKLTRPLLKLTARNDEVWELHKQGFSNSFIAGADKRTVTMIFEVIKSYSEIKDDHTDYAFEAMNMLSAEGNSVAEIAEKLGFTPRGVLKRMHKGKTKKKL